MLNFDQRQKELAGLQPKTFSSYRRQLILMFAALGITFYGAHWAADPKHWEWMVKLEQQQKLIVQQEGTNSEFLNHQSTFVKIEQEELLEQDSKKLINDAVNLDTEKSLYLNIDDSSTGLLRRELPAYFQMLKSSEQITADDWEANEVHSGNFMLLIQSPTAYRGHKFKLLGDALLISKIKEPNNQFGIIETFEIWLQTRDSGKDLYRIRSLNLPSGCTLGSQRTHLEIYALFFKRQNYASENGNRTSPMLVSSKVEFPQSSIQPIKEFQQEFFIAGTCFLLIVTSLVTWHYLADKRFEKDVIRKIKELSPEEKQALNDFSLPPDEPIYVDIRYDTNEAKQQ